MFRWHSQGLRGGLRCTAVTLVARAVSEGSVHLLLENMRQGMQGDAADGGRVGEAAVQTTALKNTNFPAFTNAPRRDDAWKPERCTRGSAAAEYVHCDTAPFIEAAQK